MKRTPSSSERRATLRSSRLTRSSQWPRTEDKNSHSPERNLETKKPKSSESAMPETCLDNLDTSLLSCCTTSSREFISKPSLLWKPELAETTARPSSPYSDENDHIQKQHSIMRDILQGQQKKSALSTLRDDETTSTGYSPPRTTSPRSSVSSSSRETSIDEKHDLMDKFLCDPQIVQEQQRILDAIQRVQPEEQAPPSRSTTAPSSAPDNGVYNVKPTSSTSSTTRKSMGNSSQVQDRVLNVYQSTKLRVKGTRHTWNDIAKGEATLVQCPGCRTILQVGKTAKLLYCSVCGDVTPMSVATDSVCNNQMDARISTVVQRQELGAAIAKKASKQQAHNSLL